ncbi:dmX-like protein 2 isoform X4 [Bufo bufo]|uniref:dmX-like protein 2 isoform X4 n=1 Tax=Bufo bufo TaxID=8384 RepID=UPI001ABE3E94|nr:dmX-like protein 2 isoform X4 [Bufo bufo]
MHLHQVLTGAVNPGDNCYSVGSVSDVPFTAYGSGCDIVILAHDFECVQIIPGAKHGNIQVSCVECSQQQGRIAASYGNTVCIFEPLATTNSYKRNSQLKYQWIRMGQFFLNSVTYNLAWDPQGNRLLTATNYLQLWAPPSSDILEEDEEDLDRDVMEDKVQPALNDWNCIWQCKTAVPVLLMKWSPDGEYFATAGKDDCLLKVWYPLTGWKSSFLPHEIQEKKGSPIDVNFSFVYLAHPRAVIGFSWRNTSRFMPRGSVCNVLLTSCQDGICRLWAETLLPEDSLLGGQIVNYDSSSSSLSNAGKRKDKIEHALETIHHLKHLRRGRRRSSVLAAHTELLPSQPSQQEAHRHISHHANSLCHFHIAASINPNTDIPSVLAGAAFNLDEGYGGFVVHWLNNKELHFTASIEIFIQHLKAIVDQQTENAEEEEDEDGLLMKLDDGELEGERSLTGSPEHEEVDKDLSTKASSPGDTLPLPTVLLERKIESLLAEWNKNADMLFTIHPVDGTFLLWHVNYLDEYNHGIFRQVQVAFSSRIPVAFPSGDASSLSKNIMMYACTTSSKEDASALLQKAMMASDLSVNLLNALPNGTSMAPTVMMVSKHIDGSLNQWAVTFANKSAFSSVLTVSHKFRYCGHRFHLNDLACHSVLPLLLTSSHHNVLVTPDSECNPWETEQVVDPARNLKGFPKQHFRNAATQTFHDPNAIYSELILWRVDPIGPLSYSGGVSELARINSLRTSAFCNVAWLPTLIPSYCLGTYCNSASACFVASDGTNLRLYQAVVDARKLLDELSDPESSKLIGEVFNIVSQQSTARPGCIIELDAITSKCGSRTQLLHVFQEDFILGYKPHKDEIKAKEPEVFFQPSQGMSLKAGYRPPPFSEKFFLVVIEKDGKNHSVLNMWHLHLKSVQACVAKPADPTPSENFLTIPGQVVLESSPETSPGTSPMTRSASIANLQTASKLILSSKLVYSQPLDIPDGVEVIRATPSAGHLSSSSIYPVCLAPYLVVTTCSDNKVRFWRCSVQTMQDLDGSEDQHSYYWKEWSLMNEGRDESCSSVSVAGKPVAVSCSYTGRLAVAYKQAIQHNGFVSKEFSMHVCLFECESTGGSEWVLEQTIHLDDLIRVGTMLDAHVSVDSNLFVYSKSDVFLNRDKHLMPNIKHLVHLDWVSKEDGSHILTVGVGSNIFMYGRLSGIVTDQTNSKDGIAVITLPLGGSIKQGIKSKWVLLRSIDLVSSVDGTPSLPVSLSWVRDGILVVGMDCEMHVYAQWKHNVKLGDADNSASEGNTEQSEQMHTISKKTSVIDGAAIVDDVFGSPTVIQDGGLFEAAHVLSPTLPQYHPTQLLELMDLGKVRRAKAILSHLVKCIAGEVAVVKDLDTGDEAAPKRHLSRTISVSGSTAKDMIITGKDGTREYTEIDSIPPLPLYALLSADQDAAYTAAEESVTKSQTSKRSFDKKTDDQYSDLFQVQNVTTDDFIGFEIEKRESRSKVINLSQYGPTYFGREHASVLSSHLMHSSLPGLTRLEQMFLVALAGTVATTSTELGESRDNSYTGGDNLDECGLRYLLAMRLHTCLLTSLPPLYRLQLLHQGLSTCHFAWAFHSEAEEEVINMTPAIQRGDPQWSELRAMGIGWWVRNINTLRRCIEKVAKASFQRNSDPLDAAIFYLAMKKKAVLWGLFRSQHDEKMTTFFSHNFKEDRWRKAALKNAFSLLGKQRFEQSAAFFLLAGSLKDAIEVCLEKMEDIQLALVIARLYESEFDTYSTYESLLYERVLGCQKDGTGFCCSKLHPDPFLRSIAYWIIKDYTKALDTLLEQTPKEDDEIPVLVKSCNPVVFSFYNFLRTHPLLIRRRVTVPEATLATVSSKTDKNYMDEINLIERKLFFTTANAHFKVGCPVLALEVLSKIPKLSKSMFNNEDLLSVGSVGPDSFHSIGKSHLEEGSESDWFSLAPSSAKQSMFEDSVNNFDWGSPLIKIEDEPLQLDWEENKESDTGDDDGLVLKSLNLEQKDQSLRDASSETPTIDNSVPAGNEVDVIAEQLKFRACLKILMTELRTLATGHEVDGGKLRFQLYNWLEKEIAAMHKIFNHETESKDFTIETPPPVDILDGHEFPDKSDIGSYERHQIERRRLQAKREHAEKRKWWLQKNQALLRVFLSYCSLHGAQGGGLASVRMELKFLLQESQQETTVKQLQSPLPLPTTLPLLSASIAVTKTVIANPVLYLNNHIHDILYTIVQMKNPPHPGNQDPKVYTLHLLAASLSASIYQALCDSHSYSSQTDANHFTGMVYQGLLLSERRRLRTESIEEHVTPNSPPATWPGVSSLINLLNTAQDEDQPKLNVLLCEAVVAVYVSLLIHALATDSSTELFRLAAHPLNNRMWAAVFGGGVKLVVKPRKPPESIPGRTKSFDVQKPQCALPLPNEEQPTAESSLSNTKNLAPAIDRGQESAVCAIPALSEEIDKHRRRFNMRMLVPGRPVKDVAIPPPVPAERPTYKEKFIPPELSMWDYFVAKPFLPLSDSGVIYDSDESIPSDKDEDDDDDAFLSDTQIQEHINSSSYSWTLIRLALVKLAIQNLKNFFPIAGLELTDLPVTSPLGIGVVKNLENWEQILHETMDQFGGPPPNYINTIPSELTVGTGPAILRHKAMLDPENTPFKSKDYTALPVKRLWHYLVKQELLQETFIRYIFTKKRKQSEVEADLGYPGGKAKIIHKESDIIMAFAINKANSNEIVLASTHDVQELDVSSLLAAQPYIWIGEEYDRESKSSDDLDFRGSTTAIHQSGVAPFHLGQIQSSSSMPWLGSGQTSTGAGILIKRNLNNVKRMASHPVHQYYLTGAQDGSVRMFEWSRPQQLICFRQAGNARVTRLYFNSQGNKCGVADGEGFLSIWQVNQTVSNPKPYLRWQCHTKTTSDFAFITSSSLVATTGQSNDNRNVCLWDTLISPSNSLVHAFNCHDNGATVLQYAPKQQLLITGGRKGYVCIFDIRQRQILHTFQAHDSAVKALALDSSEECFVTGSAEGNMKVWKLTGHGLIHSFKNEHAKQSIFRNIGAGVMQIEVGEKKRIFSCGADGTLKMRMLPTALRTQAGIFDIL